MKKKICTIIALIVIFVLSFTCPGNSFSPLGQDGSRSEDWRSVEEIENEEVLNTSISSESNAGANAHLSNDTTRQTAEGLASAGFSPAYIVENLQNQGKTIAEISFALMSVCDNDVDQVRSVLNDYYTPEQIDTVLPKVTPIANEQPELAATNNADHGPLQGAVSILADNGYSFSEIAEILNKADVSVAEAFAVLSSLGSIGEVVNNLIDAGYEREDVYEQAVIELRAKEYTAEQVMSELQDTVAGADEQAKLDNCALLTKEMLAAGYSAQEITGALSIVYGNEYTAQTAAKILQGAGLAMEEAFTALSNTNFDGAALDVGSVVSALIDGGYKKEDVYAHAVKELQAQGHTDSQIITELKGTFKDDSDASFVMQTMLVENYLSEGGLQACVMFMMKNDYSLGKINEILQDKGFSSQEIIEAVESNMAEIVQGLIDANYSVSEIVKQFSSSAGLNYATQLAECLIESGFAQDEVVAALTNYGAMQFEIYRGINNVDSEVGEPMASPVAEFSVEEGIITAFTENGYSVADTAEMFFNANVSATNVYGGYSNMLGTSEATSILIDAGYNEATVYRQVIKELNSQGITSAEEVVSEMETLGFVEAKEKSAAVLVKAMRGCRYEDQEIVTALGTLFGDNYTAKKAAKILKEAGLSAEKAFSGMVGAEFNGDTASVVDIVSALVDAKYEKADVYETAVSELKEQGYTVDEVITEFKDAKLVKAETKSAGVLAKAMLEAEYSRHEVVSGLGDLFGDNYTAKKAAKILKEGGVSIAEAFKALNGNTYFDGAELSVTDTVTALVDAKYGKAGVLKEGIAQLKDQDYSSEEIMVEFMDADLVKAEVKNAAVFVKAMLDCGYSVQETVEALGALYENNYTAQTAAKILKEADVTTKKAFDGLISTDFSPAEVVTALIDAKYEEAGVFKEAVSDLKAQGYDAQMIVNELEALVDKTIKNASFLVEAMVADGYSAPDSMNAISNILGNQYTANRASTILHDADVSVEDAFAILKVDFGNSLGVGDIAHSLTNAGYEGKDAYTQAVGELAGSSASEIMAELNHASDDQLTFAMTRYGFTLSELVDIFSSEGKGINNIAKTLEKAEVSATDAINVLANSDFGAALSVGNIAAKLISAGYEKKDVYEAAVTLLAGQGYSDDAIFTELTGQTNNRNTQIENASHIIREILGRNTLANPI